MNPMAIFAVLIALVFSWALIVSIRAGEFRYTSRGAFGQGISRVRRSDRPGVFWFLVAVHTALIGYIASFAFID
jgi:hypothetical protein